MSEIQQRPLAPTELKQHSHTSASITPVSGSVTPPSTAGSSASLSGTAHEADSPLGASPPTGTTTQLSTTNGASLAEKSASPRDPTPVSFSNSPPASQAPHEASAAAPGSATQLKQESSEQVLPHIKSEQLPVSSSSSDSSLNAWSSSASAEPKLSTPPPTAVPAATKPSSSENSVNNSVEPSTSVPPQTPASGTIVPNAKSTSQTTNGTTTSKTNISSPVCRNCKTQTTPLWRRDETGQVLCNACGLFLKLHGRPRPISLKTDTIKSRNRIKQTSNPGSKAGTSPNTPELKSRDGKSDSKSGKKSPKPKKKTGELTPLLPAHTARAAPAHTLGVHQTTSAGPTPQFPTPSTYHTHHHHHHLPFATPHMPHLPHHIVQPLHYPSSTPTQFAPSLQRITSPLLLSTTSSVRGNGKSAPVESKPVQPTKAESEAASASAASASAASALETMSSFNADLGPSATFKQRSRDDTSIPGISLMTNTRRSDGTKIEVPPGSIFSTPSSALNAPHPTPPKLPALGSRSSPPNAHLGFAQVPRAHSPETLPPPIHLQHQSQIVQMSSGSYEGNAQPRQGAQDTQNTQKSQNPQESQDNQQADQQNEQNNSQNQQRQNQQSQRNNQNNSGGAGGGAHEVTLLRTRISELELVNDLYRTRIMELEAMEQAARLREGSTRKRLDEVLAHMHESQGQPAQQGPSSSQRMPQTQQVPQNQHIHQQEHQQAGANPTLPHMFNGQLPPPVLHKSGNLLPSLASGGVVLPSLKRDFAGEFHGEGQDEVKKQRI